MQDRWVEQSCVHVCGPNITNYKHIYHHCDHNDYYLSDDHYLVLVWDTVAKALCFSIFLANNHILSKVQSNVPHVT